jgi:alkaline phosphatase
MKRATKPWTAAVVALALALAVPSGAIGAGTAKPLAHNVILMIDDGAGFNHHEVGSLYDTGLRDGEAYNEFPFQFAVTTYSYGDVAIGTCADLVGYDPAAAWTTFEYVTHDPTDSAAAATAMATGVKTYDAAIGVDCTGAPVANVVEAYEGLGKATGVVTSVPFSHATPAAFVAHNPDRDDYLGIAHEMIASSATDVIMGGGHPWRNRFGARTASPGYTWLTREDWDGLVAGTAGGDADGDAVADPWTLVENRAEFQALATGETPDRVFGMAQVRRTLQQDRLRVAGDPPAYSVPFIANVPTLAEMTNGALNVLDGDEDGFFLMVEGGATDWAAHDNQSGLLIEEEIEFDRAVDAVLAWVDLHSNWGETLVIVASDHETGYLTGPGSGPTTEGPVWYPIVDNGQGAAPGLQYGIGTHTNSLVPIYAKGDAGRLLRGMVDGTDPVRGRFVDNTDVHRLLLNAIATPAP